VGGQLARVQHNLIKRQKMHFTSLEAIGVDVIFGVNGSVWVKPWAPKPAADPAQQQQPEADTAADASPTAVASPEQRQAVCRAANAVRALAALQLPIHADAVGAVVALAAAEEVSLSHMLQAPFLSLVAAQEAQQRTQTNAI